MSNNKSYSTKNVLTFFLYSTAGIIMFFVKLPFGGEPQIPINWIVNFFKIHSAAYLPYFVLIVSAYGVYRAIAKQKISEKSATDILFSILKIIGLILIVFCVFGFGPDLILREDIGPNVLNILGITVSLTVLVGSAVLPLLLDYGLANAFGVLLRPIMRPVFKVPGKTAIVALTAYLSNYSLGHIGIDKMYTHGEVTAKEAVIVATGFSTASVVNYMVFAQMLGIMDQWGKFFLVITFITFLITAITVRLYPIKNKPNEYFPEAIPNPEPEYNKHILRNAFLEGVETARTAKPIYVAFFEQLKAGIVILSGLLPIAMFFMVGALVIQTWVPVFTWIGYLFWPLFKLVGISNLDVVIPATGTSIVDLMMVVSIGTKAYAAGGLSMTARYFLAGLPVTMIVFLSGFVPCILSTNVPVKFHELIVLWVIRVALSILLIGLFGLLFL
ncbi:MAG: YjiH family protein [Anaerofustis sp.]